MDSLGHLTRKSRADLVAESLRVYIQRSAPGLAKLPPIKVMAVQLGAAVVTVHQALQRLEAEGLITPIRGKGIFIRQALPAMELQPGQTLLLVYDETVNLDILDASERFFNTLVKQMFQAASRKGYRFVTYRIPKEDDAPAGWARIFAWYPKREVQGVIVLGISNQKFLDWMARASLPLVLVDHWSARARMDTVSLDHFQNACQATRHLLELGHRSIACFCFARPELNPRQLEGYRRALEDAGVPYRQALVVPGFSSRRGGRESVELLRQRGLAYTAVFSHHCFQAEGIREALRAEGRSIPRDVSLVTIGPSGPGRPETTWMDPRPAEIGGAVLERLYKRLEHPQGPPEEILIPPLLVDCGTTAPPRGKPARTKTAPLAAGTAPGSSR